MAKRYTREDDRALHDYGHSCADDIGRSEASAKERIQELKKSGAWKVLDMIEYLEVMEMRLSGRTLEMDAGLTQTERTQMADELVDAIYPIMKQHSDRHEQDSFHSIFEEE